MMEYDQGISLIERERINRNWVYKFCFLPHKCLETDKWIWLKGAYRGHNKHHWQLFTDYKWICREEFIKLRLLEKV